MMRSHGYRLLNTWIGKVLLFGLVVQPICGAASSGVAQTIIPDSTLGSEQSQVVPNVEIRGKRATRIGGGAARGRNLFHSFQTFSIEADQRVYFANPGRIRNIFGRVTGGSLSNLEGTLGVAGTANLFLLNPNGIIFGPNAELDLRGSFFATTADRFTFADRSQFGATNPLTSPLLTVSVPTGLQFGAVPGEIRVRTRSNVRSDIRSNEFDLPPMGGLQGAAHRTLALLGGVVRLEGGVLSVEDGRIELGSVTNSGFANFNRVEEGWDVGYGGRQRPGRNFEAINLSEGAVVSGSGTQGSVIQLRSRNLDLSDAVQIIASVSDGGSEQVTRETSATPQQAIQIVVAETLSLGESSRIATLATNDSSAGNLGITSRLMNLRNGSRIETLADSSSSPGNLNIQSQNLNIAGRSTEGISSGIFARVETTPSVDDLPDDPPEPPDDLPDDPSVPPDQAFDDQSENDSDSSANRATATSRIHLSDGVRDSSENVAAPTANQPLAQTENVDNGGYLTIEVAQTLRLSDGAEIAILTQESQVGDITLAVGNLRANQSRLWTQVGRGGAITIEAARVNLQQSQISTEQRFAADDVDEDTASLGAANLRLRVLASLTLQEKSEVATQSAAEGANLRIRSPLLRVNQSHLATQGGSERGANVTVQAGSIRLTDSNLSAVAGSGGGANLQLQGLFRSALVLNAVSSHLSTQSAIAGGANLTIAAQEMNLNDSTFTTVAGAAGGANMRLRGPTPTVPLQSSDLMLFLENRSQLQTHSAIRGGNISIDARQIQAPIGSDSDIIAHRPVQQGGNIILKLPDQETGLIGFRQGAAIPGNNTNDIDSRAGVAIRELPVIALPEVELPSEALNASEVIAQGCEPRRRMADSQGNFSVTGRGGLPFTPYEPISNSEILSDLRLPTELAPPLVEAQGWEVDRSGAIVLVAEPLPQACEEP